jgi:presenilin-like A22 family membrane protease
MVLAFGLGLYAATFQKIYVEEQGIPSPDVSAAPTILYFFAVIAVLAIALFFIPLNKLRWVFRGLFTVMYAWGIFVLLWLVSPYDNVYATGAVAVAAGLLWLFWARIWLHDILLLIALSVGGSIFGFFFSPLTFLVIMLVISVYDLLAVRFGFMVWMADKMSESTTLPAFIFPKDLGFWNAGVHKIRLRELAEEESEQREYTILGGGDIAFPLMFSASIFFQADMARAVIVGAFSLVGLMGAFLIQTLWLKGKPVPALPPVTGGAIVGFLLIRFLLP